MRGGKIHFDNDGAKRLLKTRFKIFYAKIMQ